ncbi:MAG: polysaccharide biosynthesis/export protein [Verrucomicrobiota bacterium]|jgi:protein involved in polysaccharide export with SLBB domain/capsular polysaccharide biosynthesis protein
MNENLNSNPGPSDSRPNGNFHYRNNPPRAPHEANGKGANGHATSRFDAWTFVDILAHRWHWLVICGILGAAGLFVLAWYVIQPKFTATTKLMRYETPGTSEFLKATPMTSETFAGLITSPDLLRTVGEQIEPPIPPERLIKYMKVDPQVDSDIVKVLVAALDPQRAVDIANLFASNAVVYTKELQKNQAAEIAQTYLKQQVEQMDKDLLTLRNEMRGMPMSSQLTNQLTQVSSNVAALNQSLAMGQKPSLLIAKQSEKLQAALAELSDLTMKYTDLHPLVQQKTAQIEKLKSDIEKTAAANPTGELSFTREGQVLEPDMEVIRAKLRALEDARVQMANRQFEAEMFSKNPPGVVRVFAPATLKTVEDNMRLLKIIIVAIFGGLIGMAGGLGLVFLVEVTDGRLKTVDDLKRVTKLPVLTTLGDLQHMEDKARTQWAFRTWTMLQGRLSRSANHGLVCGVTSSQEGEGRSTWISLMAEAASVSGFRVLTIATRPSPTHVEPDPDQLTEGNLNGESDMKTNSEDNQIAALNQNVLASPAQITEQLTGPNSQPVVHIPLPGWVWNLERRKEWRSALNQWRKIDNLVIFVELPPASVPEAVLLGSNLPNLVWLADSGTAEAEETKTQLQTLRDARCNLVGAVLNRESTKSLKSRFPRWLGCVALFAALGLCGAQAQNTNENLNANEPLPVEAPAGTLSATTLDTQTNLPFSIVNPVKRAPWQEHLTLGAGDVLNIGIYGEVQRARTEVAIGPDGRLTYLQAEDIMAAGLTVDELRQKIDDELGKFYRSPRTIVTPVSYKSKKYFVLGKVVQKGVYTLERPITVLEALARAKGIENGLVENDTVDMVDFSRSFLMRGGKKYSLDFEKLFQNGDLSQNIQIEPGDYLFFPSANVAQVYVLGEVSLPGMVTYTPASTVIGAIAARGGFNEKAYKSRVVVLRGSLNHPQTFVINTKDTLEGNGPDFKLEPKDIVYVTWRPFVRAEELLDLATTAFIQSVVTSWVGVNVIKP